MYPAATQPGVQNGVKTIVAVPEISLAIVIDLSMITLPKSPASKTLI